MKTYTKTELKGMTNAELREIAGTTKKSLNKSALIEMILDPKPETSSETETPETASAETETAQEEKKELPTINLLEEGKVGDVIRYKTSKKPYLVAEVLKEGDKPGVLLVSETQQYFSTKTDFEVVLIAEGEGELPETVEDETISNCLEIASEMVAERQAKRKARQDREAEKAAKKAEAEKAAQETAQEETK